MDTNAFIYSVLYDGGRREPLVVCGFVGNKKRAFSQMLFFYRFSIGINFFKVKKIVLGY